MLLLMHDCSDWPVSFLGALYVGIVPVAVNTLLTVDDYSCMLKHSRAQAVLVSAVLLPTLQAAMARGSHEVKTVVMLRPAEPLPLGILALGPLIAQAPAQVEACATGPDDPGFWLYSSGSTGQPKGALHTHANPYWTAELYGTPVLGLTERDGCFSAAKLFFTYGLDNGLSFPLNVGATTILMVERPTSEATICTC
jgi:benzoate-CoA ligase